MNATKTLAALLLAAASTLLMAAGNTEIESFNKAKRLLETKVYYDHRVTLYCGAAFDERKNVTLPDGFTTPKHAKRAHRVEWEHVVPAENFGRAFVEWREGADVCVDNRGKASRAAGARKRQTLNTVTCRPTFTTSIPPSAR